MQVGKQRGAVGTRQVHLVDEQEGRNAAPLEQLPQRQRVTLYAVGTAYDQNGAVEHLQGALHLSRKVHVTRSVQQGDLYVVSEWEDGLLGKNRDAALAFNRVGI